LRVGRALVGVVALLGCSELKAGNWTPEAGVDAGVDAGRGTDAGSGTDAGAALDAGACPRESARCGGRCVDLRADEANCGRCGARCEDDDECRDGRCR